MSKEHDILIKSLLEELKRLKLAVELYKRWTDDTDRQFEIGENLAYSNVLMWLEDPQDCEAAILDAETSLNLPHSRGY